MNGALIIDKPAGLTSHDVVARVRKLLGERRVGHTGTLDPFATGVLVVLVGRATRLAQFLAGAEKEYEAVIRLGYSTDTSDVTGRRIDSASYAKAGSSRSPSQAEIEAALASLTGEIEQVPPMYSAKKIAGRKLYEHARRGEEVVRQPIRVTIHELEALPRDGNLLKPNDDGSADVLVRVNCSAGTYIRALAEDLGKKLGIGAHLAELRRTRAGRFGIDQAITLDQLAELTSSQSVPSVLISPNETLAHVPFIELDDAQAQRTRHGIDLQIHFDRDASWRDGEFVRLAIRNQLLAVGKFDAQRQTIHPAVVLTDA